MNETAEDSGPGTGDSAGSLPLSLGAMRIALIALALTNTLVPLLYAQFGQPSGAERDLWQVIANMVTPVLAPLFLVVLLFEYVMSRVRASDCEGAQRARFIAIGRIELAVMAITTALWVPFFVRLLG